VIHILIISYNINYLFLNGFKKRKTTFQVQGQQSYPIIRSPKSRRGGEKTTNQKTDHD